MPLLLFLAGLTLVVTGVKGTVQHLGQLIGADFTGRNNFAGWIFAIGIAGGLGYIPQLRTVSTAFLVLIMLAILIRKQDDGSSTGRKFFNGLREAMDEVNGNAPASSLNDALGGLGNLFGNANNALSIFAND